MSASLIDLPVIGRRFVTTLMFDYSSIFGRKMSTPLSCTMSTPVVNTGLALSKTAIKSIAKSKVEPLSTWAAVNAQFREINYPEFFHFLYQT